MTDSDRLPLAWAESEMAKRREEWARDAKYPVREWAVLSEAQRVELRSQAARQGLGATPFRGPVGDRRPLARDELARVRSAASPATGTVH